MKIDIQRPTAANEIPLHLYQSFIGDIATMEDKENDAEVTKKMIEHFCSISSDNVNHISMLSIIEFQAHFATIFKSNLPLQRRFFIGGKEFGMIPDLENISFEEYVDLEKYISKWETMHKAMAVLYRPITERKGQDKYLIEKYQGSNTYSEVMLHMPVSIPLSASVFFWNLGQELLAATADYLKLETKKMRRTFLWSRSSVKNGDGINQYINSLEEQLKSSIL